LSHRGSETVFEQLNRIEAQQEAVIRLLHQLLEMVRRISGKSEGA